MKVHFCSNFRNNSETGMYHQVRFGWDFWLNNARMNYSVNGDGKYYSQNLFSREHGIDCNQRFFVYGVNKRLNATKRLAMFQEQKELAERHDVLITKWLGSQ